MINAIQTNNLTNYFRSSGSVSKALQDSKPDLVGSNSEFMAKEQSTSSTKMPVRPSKGLDISA